MGFTGATLEAQRVANMLLQEVAANSGNALLEKKLDASEKRRQNLEVDLKLADAERTRLRQEVELLSNDLKQERFAQSVLPLGHEERASSMLTQEEDR